MSEVIGIMEGAFFVSKNEILNWIKEAYKISLAKIEEAYNGAIYCQIIDSIHPGKVKMNKVKWNAKLDNDVINNYKILQQAFDECKINKNIEVGALMKGKPLDNLEFLQWLKRYYDLNYHGNAYDAEKRRNGLGIENYNSNNDLKLKNRNNSKNQKENFLKNNKLTKNNSKTNLQTISINNNNNNTDSNYNNNNNNINTYNQFSTIEKNNNNEIQMNINYKSHLTTEIANTDINKNDNQNQITIDFVKEIEQKYEEKIDILNDEIKSLKTEIGTLKTFTSEIGKEKDFYYSKLRDVEVLTCKQSNLDKDELINIIQKILFSEKCTEVIFDDNGKAFVKEK
jgi:hypothetical protein